MSSLLEAWALPIALLAITNISATWYNAVSRYVPEPYLDEVFHVPQAQRYCNRNYSWDPKITTPPGLYLASLLLETIIGCETTALRVLNAGAICLVCLASYQILRRLRCSETSKSTNESSASDNGDSSCVIDAHSALNMSLFPPLFFFSGLYYTDVMSTLVVLLSYSAFLKKASGHWWIKDEILTILVGITALLFRQTNIFWVAIFPAGLAVIDTLKKDNDSKSDMDYLSALDILKKSWLEGLVYDLPVANATVQDYVLICLSIVLAVLQGPLRVLRVLLPYLALLGIFASFIVWNGGVVLGDKSNHVATIHLPQMLYYWPYTIFFSFPLVLPPLLGPVIRRLPQSRFSSFCEDNLLGHPPAPTPSLLSAMAFITAGLAAVHLNTIVHPFTLADNRHYVFYVFRILLRHPAIKYAAVPLYYICAFGVISSLGSRSKDGANTDPGRKIQASSSRPETRQPCQASFVLVWLVTTALSVITAPLVEPRYFIIPWLIWRLHVPRILASSPGRPNGKPSYDMRLVFETGWHIVVNFVTGYVFLFHGFSWASEPGKIQRFMY